MKVLLLGLLFLSSIAGFASESMTADCKDIENSLTRTVDGSVSTGSSEATGSQASGN